MATMTHASVGGHAAMTCFALLLGVPPRHPMHHGQPFQAPSFTARQAPLVETRDGNQRCARSQVGHVHQEQSRGHRQIAQVVGRTQQAAQVVAVPLGDVDAQLLHQPRRARVAGATEEASGRCEGRVARAVWPAAATARASTEKARLANIARAMSKSPLPARRHHESPR